MAPDKAAEFEKALGDVPFACVGEVTAEPVVKIGDVAVAVEDLVQSYQATLDRI